MTRWTKVTGWNLSFTRTVETIFAFDLSPMLSVADGNLRNSNFACPKLSDLFAGISTTWRMRETTLNRSLFQGGLRVLRPTGYSRRDVFCMRILHVVHPATRIAQIRPFVIPTSVRESHLLPYRYRFMCKLRFDRVNRLSIHPSIHFLIQKNLSSCDFLTARVLHADLEISRLIGNLFWRTANFVYTSQITF